jgi:hypothetical protein
MATDAQVTSHNMLDSAVLPSGRTMLRGKTACNLKPSHFATRREIKQLLAPLSRRHLTRLLRPWIPAPITKVNFVTFGANPSGAREAEQVYNMSSELAPSWASSKERLTPESCRGHLARGLYLLRRTELRYVANNSTFITLGRALLLLGPGNLWFACMGRLVYPRILNPQVCRLSLFRLGRGRHPVWQSTKSINVTIVKGYGQWNTCSRT